MVYKVTKGGVRSGNTLRCIHSVKAKRYSRQTCIVSRSNLYPEEIPKLLDSGEDALLNSTLGSTDVILSLNKKGRWRVPAEISHMIKTRHFNKGKTVVSFLERHKLRRTANCIRFVSNQERLGQVAPKQKRYFSFNLNNIDRDQPNRQIKQQKGTTKKQTQQVRLDADKRKDTTRIKHVTVSASGKAEDAKKSLVSSKPEYRIEAFYPSPKSCSLTYNPKYTDVHMEFNPDGQMEIKSNARPQKGARRHRKRYSLKDLRLYEEELNGNGEHELWYDEYDEDDCDAFLKVKNVSVVDNKDEHIKLISLSKNASNIAVDEDQTQLCDNTIASFIAQAEKESNRKLNVHQQKKRSHRRSKEASASECDGKSHIVYVSKTHLNEAHDNPPSKYSTLQAAKILLKSSEFSPDRLTAKFGCRYQEGNSEPRRFTINLTEQINSLINPTNDLEKEGTLTGHLVFVYVGYFDKVLDVFKVIFNSNSCKECLIDSNRIPFKKMSVHAIVNGIVRGLNDIKIKKRLSDHYTHPREENSTSVAKLVHKCLMENTTDPHRYKDFLGEFHVTEEGENFTQHVNILRDMNYDTFCDNCCENIDTESISWTRLLGCRHVFCDDCWRPTFAPDQRQEMRY